MSSPLITSTAWLEPLLPSALPPVVLEKADAVRFLSGRLTGMLAPATAHRLARLLELTNSYYSNLIEGQYTEPAQLAAALKVRRSPKVLTELAASHVLAQRALERAVRRYQGRGLCWADGFAPACIARVHRRLFQNASDEELRLPDGSLMLPGRLRNECRLNVSVGQHDAPDYSVVLPMLERMQQAYGRVADPRLRLLAVLAYHHRLAWVHPFPDGNGRVIRMVTHLQLHQLGLASSLWSLSRGLARRQAEYYARLANADASRRGDLDGRGQLTQSGLVEFIDFMLDVCVDQMTYMCEGLRLAPLRERLERIVAMEPRLIDAGLKVEVARALHVLIAQGCVARSDFKVYMGLGDRVSIDQLSKLLSLGLVESPTPKSREIYPGLPVWFAQLLFPDLHRRFM